MLALASACATFSGAVSADEATPVVKRNVRLLTQAAPSYPEEAKAVGHQGVVKLRLSINAEGGIEDVEMTESSKSAILDAAAVEHVKAWKLLPAIASDDKTVERCAQKTDEKYWENVVSKMNAWF